MKAVLFTVVTAVLLVASPVSAVDSELPFSAPNATATPHGSINAQSFLICTQPSGSPSQWWYQTYSYGPLDCSKVDSNSEWSMLRAYRSGGTQNVHWKYTDDQNDSACLTNWTYYTSDGQTSQGVIARTTTQGDSRRWCALPVYRQGGVMGKQWAYCSCRNWSPPSSGARN